MSSREAPNTDELGEQDDLLRSAVQEGYFKVPRETTLVELANQYDISDQEASEQLRRQLDALAREAVFDN